MIDRWILYGSEILTGCPNINLFALDCLFSRPPYNKYTAQSLSRTFHAPLTSSPPMVIPLRDPVSTTCRVKEDKTRRDRLHYWLSETADTQMMHDALAARADSPVLGFDHCPQKVWIVSFGLSRRSQLCFQPLPDPLASVSRLRSPSVTSPTLSTSHSVALGVPVPHRRSSSQISPSSGLSRRPSLPRNTSLPLLSETGLDLSTPASGQSYLRSITSSLPLGSHRNAVYFDSEQLSSRLDEWVSSGNTEFVHDVQEDLEGGEYYATQFETDSPLVPSMTPASVQGPPPNTPMTAYYRTPYASSSQVYVGRTTPVPLPEDDILADATSSSFLPNMEDVRTTPVPHGKLSSVPSSPSSSASSSPFLEGETTTTPRTSPRDSPTSTDSNQVPRSLHSKPSLGLLSPKPSLSSIALGYQNHVSNPAPTKLLSPPVTASRWSLTSSVAEEGQKDKSKKEKRKTRKRLVSFISKISGNATNKDIKESSPANQEKPLNRERSNTNVSVHDSVPLPPVALKSPSKPPPLKLTSPRASQSVANLRSPTLTLSSKPSLTSLSIPYSPTGSSFKSMTPTTTIFSPSLSSPISTHFSPPSPVDNSFTSRLSVSASMTTISTNTASPVMPNTPILGDVQLTSPPLKNALSVPALSPASEGPALLRRGSSCGWGMNRGDYESRRVSIINTFDDDDDDDLEDDAEYYTREFSILRQDPLEEERKARLSIIADMLDRDLGTPIQQEMKIDESVPRERPIPLVSGTVRPEGLKSPLHCRTSPVSIKKPSNASRTSSPVQRRSGSSSYPISPTISTPAPVPSKNSFKVLAARIRNSNAVSTPHRPLSMVRVEKETDSKRKSIVNLIPNTARKNPKRRLVISGVGDGQQEVSALKEWCASLGEVRSMVKTTSPESQIGQGQGSNVWIIDFKKSTVAESVSFIH